MHDPILAALRAGLDAWERDAAAQWDTFIRSPRTLQRLGEQVRLTLESQRRIRRQFATHVTGQSRKSAQTMARLAYTLERLEHQIAFLSARIAQIERTLHHD